MAKKKSSGCGCLVLLVLGGVFVSSLSGSAATIDATTAEKLLGPVIFLIVVFAFLFWVGSLIKITFKSTCGICGTELRKVSYDYKLEGKSVKVCPNCNSALEKDRSKKALKERGLI